MAPLVAGAAAPFAERAIRETTPERPEADPAARPKPS